jgi:type II secretory pathway component PulF
MATFSYLATDDDGKEFAGTLEAGSLLLAVNQVLDLSSFPIHIEEQRRKLPSSIGRLLARILGRSPTKKRAS